MKHLFECELDQNMITPIELTPEQQKKLDKMIQQFSDEIDQQIIEELKANTK